MRLLGVLAVVLCPVYGLPSKRFIYDYFATRGVTDASLYLCRKSDGLRSLEGPRNYLPSTVFVEEGGKELERTWNGLKNGIFVDLQCNFSLRYLHEASKLHMFNTSYTWLLWDETGLGLKVLKDLDLQVNSDVILASPNSNIMEAFKISSDLFTINHGVWLREKAQLLFKTSSRRDLRNVTLRGSFVLTDLKVNLSTMDEQLRDRTYFPELDILNRFHYILHHTLRDMLSFKLEEVVSDSWGYLQNNSRFNGMMGEIENGTTEFGLSPCQPRQDRMDVSEFLIPMHDFRLCFVFRQPNALGTAVALALPLEYEVWISIVAFLLISSVCFVIINHFHWTKNINEKSFSYGLVFGLAIFAQQGLITDSSKLSSRILNFTMLTLSVILYAYYNAQIMNALLSPSQNVIKTVNQLVESSLTLGMLDIPYVYDRVTATDPVTARAYRKIMSSPIGLVKLQRGVAEVKKGQYAFYAEDNILYAKIDKTFNDLQKCDLKEVDMLSSFLIASPIRRNSQYKELFNYGILRMIETGIVQREDKVWYYQKPECFGSQNVLRVSLEATTIANSLVAAGFLSSLVILVVEIILVRRERDKKRKVKKNT